MSLHSITGILVALAILSIASVTTAGGALAHGAHAHRAVATPALSQNLGFDEQAPAAEIAAATQADNLALPVGDCDAPDDRSPAPCQGHCCGVAGLSCCGLIRHPVWIAALFDSGSGEVIAVNDRSPEGLGPSSILRPPRTIA